MDRRAVVMGLGGAAVYGAMARNNSVFAASGQADDFNEDEVSAINQISEYFTAIKTMRGNFEQTDARGNISEGIFFISKPGKMRFEYSAPNPYLIISDGKWVLVRNRRRGRTDKYPLSGTPLNFVLADNVDLLRDTVIKHIVQYEGIATVALKSKNRLTVGNLIVTFDTNENRLQQWAVIDPQGRRTTVALDAVETDIEADPQLFEANWVDRDKRRQDSR